MKNGLVSVLLTKFLLHFSLQLSRSNINLFSSFQYHTKKLVYIIQPIAIYINFILVEYQLLNPTGSSNQNCTEFRMS